MASEQLLKKHPEYLNGHRIDWNMVHYLYAVTKEFEPGLDFSDSDRFTVGDSLATLFNLLRFLLQINPSSFKNIHQELLLTVADYIFGADVTRRRPARGSFIKSRANRAALVGFSLEYFSRTFEFTAIRNRLKAALTEFAYINVSTYDTLMQCFEESVPVWKQTVRDALAEIAESIIPDEEVVLVSKKNRFSVKLSP